MNRKDRHKLIVKAKLKLELINDMRQSFEYYDDKANSYVYCNYNFSDVYQYFRKAFELIDIETNKKISFNDSFFRFFGLLQVIYVQQDLIDAIAKVFGVNIKNSPNRKINRELRDQLIGHPLSNERNSNERNKKKSKNNADKINSTIILKKITPKSFHYINYDPENEIEKYSDKIADIDSIIERHIDFLNEALNLIVNKCFTELQRQILKQEKFINKYYNGKIPAINKYKFWFKEYLNNSTSFEFEKLCYCSNKKNEHKRYEVYLVEFERMIVVSYLEMVDIYKIFSKRMVKLNSVESNFQPDKLVIKKLKQEKKKLESYFEKSSNLRIGHDLSDISKPYNDLWDIGFNQLSRIFSNDIQIRNELNNLKITKSDKIEYEISYRYICFLVGSN